VGMGMGGDTFSRQSVEQLTQVFELLADATRLKILMILSGGERNVTSLCKELKLPQPTISHHLGLLRMRNLIDNRRDGKHVFYCLSNSQNFKTTNALAFEVNGCLLTVMPRKD